MDPNMTPEEATVFAISQVIQPTKLKESTFLAVGCVLLVMVAGTVSVRTWSNYKHARKIFYDDWLSFLALACLIWNTAIFYILVQAMNMDPRDVSVGWFTTRAAVGIFAGNSALYTAKLPLLFLYIRTFGVVKWLKFTCIALVVFGGLGFLSTATYATVTCSPDLHRNDFPPVAFFKCITGITNACIARASFSLTMDVFMFFLPLPVIKGLNLPFRRKAGLALVFATGLLAIASSAVGLYFQTTQEGGSSDNFANGLIITVVESAIVILVSCAPALHLFWTKQMGRIRQRLGLSTIGTKNSKHSTSSKSRTTNSRPNGSTRGIEVRTDNYIELSDGPLYKQPGANTENGAYQDPRQHV